MVFATPLQTNKHVLEKVAVATVALTLFYFCNPSKLPGSIPTEKAILWEVNWLRRMDFVKFTPLGKKTLKWKTLLFHWF